MAKKKSTVAAVFGILQIVFGSLSLLLGPLLYFSGAQQALTSWLSNLMKGPGQPDLSAERLMAEVVRRTPWFPTFEFGHQAVNLLLCVMMIVGGIGLLQMRRWAHRVTIVYALLSIVYTPAVAICAAATVTPVQMELTAEAMREEAKARGRPGPVPEAEMMENAKPVAAIGGGICGSMMAIYPILVLIFMSLRSVRAVFSGVSLPEEPEDYDDRNRDEGERDPYDRSPPDELDEPDDRFRTER
jgi:hypothetical protein